MTCKHLDIYGDTIQWFCKECGQEFIPKEPKCSLCDDPTPHFHPCRTCGKAECVCKEPDAGKCKGCIYCGGPIEPGKYHWCDDCHQKRILPRMTAGEGKACPDCGYFMEFTKTEGGGHYDTHNCDDFRRDQKFATKAEVDKRFAALKERITITNNSSYDEEREFRKALLEHLFEEVPPYDADGAWNSKKNSIEDLRSRFL